MQFRLCPSWFLCRVMGDRCFHNHKHKRMESCDIPGLKSNFGRYADISDEDRGRCLGQHICLFLEQKVQEDHENDIQ